MSEQLDNIYKQLNVMIDMQKELSTALGDSQLEIEHLKQKILRMEMLGTQAKSPDTYKVPIGGITVQSPDKFTGGFFAADNTTGGSATPEAPTSISES